MSEAPGAPARVVLVHGAAGGPWTFDGWLPMMADLDVAVPDLQEGLDVAHATMGDYTEAVVRAVGAARRAVLVGFSMGGLVAMLAARRVAAAGLVVVEPSPPAEVVGTDPDVVPRPGVYGAGPDTAGPDTAGPDTAGPDTAGPDTAGPDGATSGRDRRESTYARAERHRGISVPALPCPLLVVAGRDFADTRGEPVARRYGGELAHFPGLGHTDLVRDPAPVGAVLAWVRARVEQRAEAR